MWKAVEGCAGARDENASLTKVDCAAAPAVAEMVRSDRYTGTSKLRICALLSQQSVVSLFGTGTLLSHQPHTAQSIQEQVADQKQVARSR